MHQWLQILGETLIGPAQICCERVHVTALSGRLLRLLLNKSFNDSFGKVLVRLHGHCGLQAGDYSAPAHWHSARAPYAGSAL
jgi:hypothetical protein